MYLWLPASWSKGLGSRSIHHMWSNTIPQYNTSSRNAICIFACAKLIRRVLTYAPTLMHHFSLTLTTRHSWAISYYWQTSTMRPKSRRVARYTLGAVTCDFADAFFFLYWAKTGIEKLLDRRVSLLIFTDSKSLFDVIRNWSQTQKRRFIIDLEAVRDAYAMHDINNVGFIRGLNNPTDCLTKIGKCDALYCMSVTGKCEFFAEQWVIRCQNWATPANYLSTASIFYLRSCMGDVIHPSRDKTSSYTRSSENAIY